MNRVTVVERQQIAPVVVQDLDVVVVRLRFLDEHASIRRFDVSGRRRCVNAQATREEDRDQGHPPPATSDGQSDQREHHECRSHDEEGRARAEEWNEHQDRQESFRQSIRPSKGHRYFLPSRQKNECSGCASGSQMAKCTRRGAWARPSATVRRRRAEEDADIQARRKLRARVAGSAAPRSESAPPKNLPDPRSPASRPVKASDPPAVRRSYSRLRGTPASGRSDSPR